jgi:hypothetical protein
MIEAEIDGRGENNIMTLTQSPSGCSIVITINRDVEEEDWDEFTLLIENLKETMSAMMHTSDEEGFTVSYGRKGTSILVENVED